MNEKFFDALKLAVGNENVCVDEAMKSHITFRVGGNADYYVTPENEEQIANIISLCKETDIPYYIIGNGSNLLVRDEGYRGVIIEIGKKYSGIWVEENTDTGECGNTIIAKAGAKLAQIATLAMQAGLTGMEFAHGIPGTLGGAVVMNAGAYGGEMKDILTSVKVLDSDGNIITLDKDSLELGYRHSIIPEKQYIVLEAEITLSKGDITKIKATMEELANRRREKQPLEYPSAGSTFKRPEGYFAGKLIEDAGLKGYRCGGAMVSEKHSGFVINYDNATADDILRLIKDVQDKVKEKYGVSLEAEVKIL